MGKHSVQDGESKAKRPKANVSSSDRFSVDKHAVDPTLALLFASSSGPVQAPPKSRYEQPPPQRQQAVQFAKATVDSEDTGASAAESEVDEDEELSSVEGDLEDADALDLLDEAGTDESVSEQEDHVNPLSAEEDRQPRKRKRQAGGEVDDLEGKYMLKLAREEEREEDERKAERKLKRQRVAADQGSDALGDADSTADSDDDDDAPESDNAVKKQPMSDVPMHETLAPSKESTEIEKASRTVFLANVSTACITDKKAKKELMDHMGSFLDSLPTPKDGQPKHRVESLRFRSTAYAGTGIPKKAAFATKNLMEATTKSTNAYVVYSTAFAAREAVKHLNATVILDRHLRVDGVAHPAKTDHRRCVFVGNLGFVDDESMMDQGGEGERKRSKIPSDIEEGLWRQFGKAGKVESVRVVRDEKTRVGKGFAYVQFEDANAVEEALLYNEKKYPPMLPRVLRVTRAKAMAKTALASQRARPGPKPQARGGAGNPNNTAIYNPKISSQQQSLQGRANKLLGKAGAAQFRKRDDTSDRERRPRAGLEGIARTPENIVMEGYRASANSGRPKDLKFGKGGKKKQGKPTSRSSKRGSEWKKGAGKKGK